MDDARLWEEMQQGAPVAHCRAKIEHDRLKRIEGNNRRTARELASRPRLGARWAA